MEFQLSSFKSWKIVLWKCYTQYASQFGKLSSGHRTGKGQFSFQSQRKGNAKECSNYCTIALISHTSKVMLKILQARLQQYMNSELSDVQARFKRQRNQRSNCQHPLDHRKIKRVSEKASTSALLTLPKPLTLWNTTNFGKFNSGHRTGKGQFLFQSQRKAMPRNAQITAQLHSSHTLEK